MARTTAELNEKDRALVERVRRAYDSAEDHHKAFRDKGARFYAKYRSYKDFKRSHAEASGRDVQSILRDAAGPFGTDLFIPYGFSTIETIAPRMLAGNPKLLIEPAQPEFEDNVENIRLVIDRQQSKIGYPLILQDVAKNGLIYGLGWQKTYWHDSPVKVKKVLEQGTTGWVVGEQRRRGYCGPMAEACDPWDVIWDPKGHDVETCRWIIHRTWPGDEHIRKMVEQGTWKLPDGWDLDDLLAGGSDTDRQTLFSERERAAGIHSGERRGDRDHELWEFHDAVNGDVITVLDKTVPVQHGPNPFWHGELPFQVFRPTRVPGEMAGVGEIEAIEDLIEEMNVMRSQRRDNAAIVLQRPFFYFDGMLNPKDFVFGPGKAIPVDGDPRNVIFPAPLQDIPASSYQEDQGLQRDIERTLGIDDSTMGGGTAGQSETATGAQLVTAAAGIRIQAKTKRCELETVKPTARQFLELNQQYIIEEQVIPGPPRPGEQHHRAFSWYEIGPAQLAGEYEIEPEGGSLSPQSKIERQQRAQAMMVAFANNPLIDQRTLFEHVLREGFEVENPTGTGWLAPEEPDVPIEAIDLAAEALAEKYGVDPGEFHGLINEAAAMVEQMKGGPGPGMEGQPPPREVPVGADQQPPI